MRLGRALLVDLKMVKLSGIVAFEAVAVLPEGFRPARSTHAICAAWGATSLVSGRAHLICYEDGRILLQDITWSGQMEMATHVDGTFCLMA